MNNFTHVVIAAILSVIALSMTQNMAWAILTFAGYPLVRQGINKYFRKDF